MAISRWAGKVVYPIKGLCHFVNRPICLSYYFIFEANKMTSRYLFAFGEHMHSDILPVSSYRDDWAFPCVHKCTF